MTSLYWVSFNAPKGIWFHWWTNRPLGFQTCAICPTRPDVVEDEQANRRGQIALLACLVDLSDQRRQGRTLGMGYFLQANPECVFEANARLVSTDDDGTFDY